MITITLRLTSDDETYRTFKAKRHVLRDSKERLEANSKQKLIGTYFET